MSATWEVHPPAWPRQVMFEPSGDVLAALCSLAAAALCQEQVQVWGVPECEPTISLRRVLAQLGVQFVPSADGWLTVVPPASGLRQPAGELDCGRELDVLLLAGGLLAGAGLPATLVLRSMAPRRGEIEQACGLLAQLEMEAAFLAEPERDVLQLGGGTLQAAALQLPVALGALKPMLVLACQQADGECELEEPCRSADHAERALNTLGARLAYGGHTLRIQGRAPLRPRPLKVPPDISAGLPLAAAIAARPGSALEIPVVGMNPARSGWLRSLQRCGVEVERTRDWQFGTEPVSSLRLAGRPRPRACVVPPNAGRMLRGEIGALAAFASQCHGQSQLRGAAVLREGTPDRLALAQQMLLQFGAKAELLADGLSISGPARLRGAEVNCAGDRNLAQLALTAALLAEGPSILHGMQALDNPWPGLRAAVRALGAEAAESA